MGDYYIIKVSIIFIGSLVFSTLINRIFLKFSKNLGIRNIDDQVVRWNTTAKPAFGGISFFIVFLLVLAIYQIVFPMQSGFFNLELIGLVSATSIGFLAGLTDDAFNTNPILKSLAQLLCAMILIFTDNYIQLFEIQWINYFITVLWVFGLMNSINMLDNMDAVSTVASLFALLSMVVVILFNHTFENAYFILVIGLIGSLLGFLYFNWHPSRMYMGDTGSQFLGVVLAALSIKFLWNNQMGDSTIISRQFILPLLAFLVPICDTTTVTINRIARGQSPFVGGKDHTTHHLSYLGFSEHSVPLIIGGIGLISTVIVLIAINLTEWTHLFTIIFASYAIIVFVSLFLVTKVNHSKTKENANENKAKNHSD